MIEAVITPLAHSRTLRIEKLPAFNRRNDRSSSIEKQLPLSAAWARARKCVRRRSASPDRHDKRPRASEIFLRAALPFSDRRTTRLPARGHRLCLQPLHPRPLRRPPRAGLFAVRRLLRSRESTAAPPSPPRFQSTAKDHCWVTRLLI